MSKCQGELTSIQRRMSLITVNVMKFPYKISNENLYNQNSAYKITQILSSFLVTLGNYPKAFFVSLFMRQKTTNYNVTNFPK